MSTSKKHKGTPKDLGSLTPFLFFVQVTNILAVNSIKNFFKWLVK